MELPLIIDPVEGRALASLKNDNDVSIRDWFFGEVIKLRIARANRIAANGSGLARVPDPVSLAGWGIRVGLGTSLTNPTAGNFTLRYETSTAVLPYNFTAGQLNVAISAMADFVADGGGFAVDEGNGLFLITFNVAGGGRSMFTAEDFQGLTPQSTAEILRVEIGAAGVNEKQSLRLLQLPAVEQNAFVETAAAAAVVTVLSVGGVGLNHKASVAISPEPFGGVWTVTIGGAESRWINFDAAASDIEDIVSEVATVGVDANGDPNVSVSVSADGVFLFTFIRDKAATNMGAITADVSALRVLRFMEGYLDLRDIDAERLLDGLDSADLFLEVEFTPPAGTPQKSLVMAQTLRSPVLPIDSAGGVPVSPALGSRVGSYMFRPDITTYLGGTANAVDAIQTTGLSVPQLLEFDHPADGLRRYVLRAGNTAEDAAAFSVIRPDDYNAITNQKIWVSAA